MGRELGAEHVGDLEDRLIARGMAVRVVEETEVVDVEQCDAERTRSMAPAASIVSASASTRLPWFMVPVSGSRRSLRAAARTPADAALGGAEDEEERIAARAPQTA